MTTVDQHMSVEQSRFHRIDIRLFAMTCGF